MSNEFGMQDVEALGKSNITENLLSASVTIKEMNNSFKTLNETMMKIVRINAEIANTQGFKTLEGVGKQLNSSKTNSALQKFSKSLSKMTSAQFLESLGLMEGLSAILEALFSPLSLVSPLLQVIAAIVQEAMAPTLIEMTPYIKMAAMFLIEHKDSIKAFIQVTTPLVLVLHLLTGNTEAISNAFKRLGIDFNVVGNIFIFVNDKLNMLSITFTFFQENLTFLDNKLNETINQFADIGTKFSDLGETMREAVLDWKDTLVEAFEDLIEDVVDSMSFGSGGGGGGGSGGGDDDDGGFIPPLPFGISW